tara:strand:+ start:88 stop:384 length:297 start_codon:yes stop_codon:yes gene_type:complete
MALDKTAQAALVTELREWHHETGSEFDSKWGEVLTVYRTPRTTPLEQMEISAVFNISSEEPEILSRTLLSLGRYELLVFGSHSKLDTAGVWTEFTGEE